MAEPAARPATYYPALTGLRVVAALLVFFFHFNPFLEGLYATTAVARFFAAILDTGVGLNIFFVMSGFVITTRYQDRVELSPAWWKQYMLNRFARIYPLYFILTVLTFTAMAGHLLTWYTFAETATLRDKIVGVITNLTLTRSFFQWFYLLGVPTAWSLTVEECFYVSAPFLMLALRRRSWLLPILGLGIVLAGCLLALVANRLQLYAGFMQPFSFVLQFTYFGRCVEFLAGIGLAVWLKKRGRATAPRGTTLLGIGLIVASLCLTNVIPWAALPLPEWAVLLATSLLSDAAVSAGIVVLFYGLIQERTRLQWLLGTKPFDLLGKSTYAFYLIHLGLFSDLLQRAIGLHILLFYLIFNVAAILLYKWVEQPLHTAIRRRFRPALA